MSGAVGVRAVAGAGEAAGVLWLVLAIDATGAFPVVCTGGAAGMLRVVRTGGKADGSGVADGAGDGAVTATGGWEGPNKKNCHRTRATPPAMQISPTNARNAGLRVAGLLPGERPSAINLS